ncbi:MAG TPA: hypothetical protein VE692_03025, partial [Nitrososphaera sp.]|nr:hypothetical protein [Nitrososphaera sp.]
HMRMLAKTTTSLAALMLAITASALFAAPAAASGNQIVMNSEQHLIINNDNNNHNANTQQQHVNSLRVTQSGGNEPEVECEGNWKCETIGNTVVATSEDNDTIAIATTTVNQSSIQLDNGADDGVSVINQDDAAGLVSTIISRLFNNPILHWWLGG